MNKQEVLKTISSELEKFESTHGKDLKVMTFVEELTKSLSGLRDYKPVLSANEVYEHIRNFETNEGYRSGIDMDYKQSEDALRQNSSKIALELAKYSIAVVITSPDKEKGQKLELLNAQAIFTTTP